MIEITFTAGQTERVSAPLAIGLCEECGADDVCVTCSIDGHDEGCSRE